MPRPGRVADGRRNGFTLIEVMIVLVVVAIMASIALPAWQDQLRRSRRSDAMEALAVLQQAQERWRANNPTYAAELSDLGLSSASPDGLYTISIVDADADGYSLSAEGRDGSGQDHDTGCTTLTMQSAAGTISTAPDACWRR